MSELLKTLNVADELRQADLSAAELQSVANCSPATLKRYLADLRHLGCIIVSMRRPDGWVYRLENVAAVSNRLDAWLRLERQRTLIGPDA